VVHPRSDGLGLIRIDLISTVCFGSGRSGARPRLLSVAGSNRSVCLPTSVADLPGPLVSACPRPRARLRDLFSVVDLRSDGRESPIPVHVVKLLKRPPTF
jgi:hypothetical protein